MGTRRRQRQGQPDNPDSRQEQFRLGADPTFDSEPLEGDQPKRLGKKIAVFNTERLAEVEWVSRWMST